MPKLPQPHFLKKKSEYNTLSSANEALGIGMNTVMGIYEASRSGQGSKSQSKIGL